MDDFVRTDFKKEFVKLVNEGNRRQRELIGIYKSIIKQHNFKPLSGSKIMGNVLHPTLNEDPMMLVLEVVKFMEKYNLLNSYFNFIVHYQN